MTINALDVKNLREKTEAGIMDCKRALSETNGDFEAAVDWLRKKGLSAAAKKSSRIAAEGLVSVEVAGKVGVVLELNSETDFVAKNSKFQELAQTLAREFLSFDGNLEEFKEHTLKSTGRTVANEIAEHVAVIGENMNLRRAIKVEVSQGVVVPYVHNQTAPGLGKIGVLVALESDIEPNNLVTLGRQLAMHIAANKPESLSVADLDKALVEKEKQFLIEQARASGKPDNVIEKMIEGRIIKFYEQVVLTEQLFVMDGKTRVSEVVTSAGKDLGGSVKIAAFARLTLGEGVDKKEENFAEEVAKVMQSA
jgi:elongation factor Ts